MPFQFALSKVTDWQSGESGSLRRGQERTVWLLSRQQTQEKGMVNVTSRSSHRWRIRSWEQTGKLPCINNKATLQGDKDYRVSWLPGRAGRHSAK